MEASEPVNHTQITILVTLSTVLTGISTVVVVTRSWIRFFVLKKAGLDDWMSIGALIFTLGYLATLYVGKAKGMGSPMETISIGDKEALLRTTFAIELLYYSVITCVKSSIVFMYHRIAVTNSFKNLCKGTNSLLAIFYIVCIGVVVGQCRPLQKAWDLSRLVQGSCINTTAFFYFTSVFGIILDLWILMIPIRPLKHLQISKRSRHILYGVFGAGGVATAFSCVRLYSIHTYTLATDPFRDSILVNVWSMVEINVAIWCASAPALKPLFSPRRFLDSRKSTSRNYHNLTHPVHSKQGVDGSTSQSLIVPIHISNNYSALLRGSSPGPEEIELGRPRQAHV
ncbi:uncharacterized protein F4812DRAFT_465710 [Daldinia caldariorum]|uniref:uncharacterized protein n=1 Tax=Daldinia caldariorum TaxID=326644 RepID=UPI00200813D9|nr:uncharacterized protein F4812DRAFT_465710 [Daldinia caldariorum]KAI1466436.1 hypothetical protein F4812DRAFT_465710 [Daldinia caldariorum]